MKSWFGRLFFCGAGLALLGAAGLAGCAQKQSVEPLKILWADWPPSDALADLSKLYTGQSGVPVEVVKKSWDGAFSAATFSEFRNRSANYDIIIGDSQWLGLGAVGGHYLELTSWIPQNIPVAELAPNALKWYSEYPKGSGRLYAVPCEGDAMAWAYRKDLFQDPGHRQAFADFLVRNGVDSFPLAPPQTWTQLLWIARYFHQAVPGMAGVAMVTSRSYDNVTMSFEQLLWSMGGDFGNYQNYTVDFDSPQTVRALQFFDTLLNTTSPGGRNLDYGAATAEFIAGRAAMMCDFFAFMPSLMNPLEDPDYHDKTGFFNSPAFVDSDGVRRRATSLGGQGMSINAHIPPARRQLALDYLKWFSSTEVQRLWAAKGGFTLNLAVMRSPEFLRATPYNPLFEEAFGMMRDFWNVPEYDQLLSVTQREICAVIQNGESPEVAARRVQEAHERILAPRRALAVRSGL